MIGHDYNGDDRREWLREMQQERDTALRLAVAGIWTLVAVLGVICATV